MKKLIKTLVDKGNSNKQIYGWLNGFAVAITLCLIEIYTEGGWSIVNRLESFGISVSESMENTLDGFINWFCFGVMFFILKALIVKGFELLWNRCHLGIYIEGQWFAVHEKELVRIGIADIKQDFYDISVKAFNVDTNEEHSQRKTNWRYIGTAFKPDENADIKFMGCYFAQRKDEAPKQGIHMISEVEFDGKKIIKMSGQFGDVLRMENGQPPQDANDKTGKIHMYKISDNLRKYLEFESIDKLNEKKLRMILASEDESVMQETFVKDLRKMFYRSEIRRKWGNIQKAHFNNERNARVAESDAERAMITALIYLVFADGEIDENELKNLANITGMRWDMEKVYECRVCDEEGVINDLRDIITQFGNDRYAANEYKAAIRYAAQLIAFSNEKLDTFEKNFIERLETEL